MSRHRGYDLPSRSLVSQADQSMVERPDVPRSRFTMQWSHKKTFDAGRLYPFCVFEVLPGDHLKFRASPFVRTATPVFPILDAQRVDVHWFYVPYRLLWVNWVRMMGEQDSPGDSIAYTVPRQQSPTGGFVVGGLHDHFGLPTVGQVDGGSSIFVSAFPCRAYQLIFNQWFRDENLVNAAVVSTADGADVTTSTVIQRRAKSHDYFTSALPAPQKFTAPSLPLAGIAYVSGLGSRDASYTQAPAGVDFRDSTSPPVVNYANVVTSALEARATAGGFPDVYVDLASATGVSINELRQAFLIQQYLEKDARGGTRYTERNLIHFGVRSPDARLQRAEYIGGGSTPVQFTPIAQTVADATDPLGNLGAAGTASGQATASYAAVEDGLVLGLISVKSELSYSQGIPRMWSRLSRFDFYVPTLAGLGEQAVLRKEIYARGTVDDDLVFGYQERFQELRTRYSEVTGLFRPTATGAIDEWHLSQLFSSPPTLGATFIGDDPPMDRVLAAGGATAGQQYLGDILIQVEATRPVPVYGTPVQLGRF